jgi:hypothetical protein
LWRVTQQRDKGLKRLHTEEMKITKSDCSMRFSFLSPLSLPWDASANPYSLNIEKDDFKKDT